MTDPHLLDYVRTSLEAGHSVETIASALLEQGWTFTEIQNGIEEAKSTEKIVFTSPQSTEPKKKHASEWNIDIDIHKVSASQILLYLGGIIVVIAAIFYISLNWMTWGALPRIIAILLPTLICYGIGAAIFDGEHKKTGALFLTTGSFLLPFFLFVLFRELALFDAPTSNASNFGIAFLSLLTYIATNLRFRFPLWTILSQGMGIFAYYFFFQLLGVPNILQEPTAAWLLLFLGGGYILAGPLYKKQHEPESAHYSVMLGGLVLLYTIVRLISTPLLDHVLFTSLLFVPGIIFSLIGIYFETNESIEFSAVPFTIGTLLIIGTLLRFLGHGINSGNHGYFWLLIVLGLVYFLVGVILEYKKMPKFGVGPYLAGFIAFFVSLFYLATNGYFLLDSLSVSLETHVDLLGWSHALAGILFLLFAWTMTRIVPKTLTSATKFTELFHLLGAVWILGSIFFIGTTGTRPFYEALVFLLSLGFIFGSIPARIRQYLLAGTLFLVASIFAVGSEYFQNQVGWPITLFVAGLASMGIGLSIEQIRRRYFSQKTR